MGSLFSRTQNDSRTQAQQFVEDHGVHGVLTEWRDVKLNFGVTGSSGAGKSAFINAIRGLRDNDEGAARVSVNEETKVPTPYPFPNNPFIILWDLPGLGGLKHTDIKEYTNSVSLTRYAALLIFMRGRLTHHDLELAKEVKSMGKPFFFIRAHAEYDCENALRSRGVSGTNNEEEINAVVEETLNKMRRDCFKNVKHLLTSERDVFLIDNYVTVRYDFDRLVSAIDNALPERLKEAFVLSLSNLTPGTLKRKARWLKVRAAFMAGAIAPTSFIPVPGVGAALDLALILHEITDYPKILCLPEVNSVMFVLLKKEFQEEILKHSFTSTLQLAASLGAAGLTAELGQEVAKYIPGPGTIISCAISMAFITNYLHRCIDDLENLALQIWEGGASQLTWTIS